MRGFVTFAVLAFLAAAAIGFGVLLKQLSGGPPNHNYGVVIDAGVR